MSRDRIKRVLSALDIGFSDSVEGENVRQFTLEEKLETLEQVVDIIRIEEAVNFSIRSSRGVSHPVAEIYAIDFPSDLRASTYLILGGYYRQAILCLRNWLEIRLTGIYFSIIDENKDNCKKWKDGNLKTSTGTKLYNRFFGHPVFQRIDAELDSHRNLYKLHKELSSFTHGAGMEPYNLQEETDNVPRFNPQSVDLWFSFVRRAFIELAVCYLTAYGEDALLGLQTNEVKKFHKLLPTEYQRSFTIRSIFKPVL